MTVKVTIKSKMKKNTDKAVERYKQNTSIYLNKVGNMFRNHIMLGMQQTPRQGEPYTVGGKTVRRSIKDNPPAVDTGRLKNSFTLQRAMPSMTKQEAQVFTKVSYANILEQSFARGGLQRPFMGKESQAFKDTKQFAERKFKDISLGNVKIT